FQEMTITTKKSPKEAFLEAIANGLTTTKFASLKDRALSLLEEHGLPSNKAEEYKYTPITRKLENTISNFTEAAPADISKERVLEEHIRSEEHTSELQSRENLVCRLLLEKK